MSEHGRRAVSSAVNTLASFAFGTSYEYIPAKVKDRISVMLLDLVGVTLAGSRTHELTNLVQAWDFTGGPATLIGQHQTTDVDTAALINAASACCLELDEGNKYARGHPAAHVVFAAFAAAESNTRTISGHQLLSAITGGYEIAARFGAATTLRDGWHPHGHWGATGAAGSVALLKNFEQPEIAAAIDTTAGLMHVTPWPLVTEGAFSRNLWAGQANIAGLHAGRLVEAGLSRNTGALAETLGGHIGALDSSVLVAALGDNWLVTEGYSKLHPSCSYTHTSMDIIQRLKSRHGIAPQDIDQIDIKTHSLAVPLIKPAGDDRLSAMFSLPFMAASAVMNDVVTPVHTTPGTREFNAIKRLSERVAVNVLQEYDKKLPSERWATVDIKLTDNTVVSLSQPNPIGDVDYFPLDQTEIENKLARLLGSKDVELLKGAINGLLADRDASEFFESLNSLGTDL